MHKKLISLALILCLCLSLPAFALEVEEAGPEDFTSTFSLERITEAEGEPNFTDALFILTGIGSYSGERSGRFLIGEGEVCRVTNTGSTVITASGEAEYDLLIHLFTYAPLGGETYALSGSYTWHREVGFTAEGGALRIGAGESAAITAADLRAAEPGLAGGLYELFIEARYRAVEEDWQTYKRYMSEIERAQRGGSVFFQLEEPEAAGATQPTEAVPFADVAGDAYYAAAVAWAVESGVTNGTGPTTFSPDQTCTQAEILTFLFRTARGEGEAGAEDMAQAVVWAEERGMIDSFFDGSLPCTRAATVKYIWQAFGAGETGECGFADVPQDADYAAAVAWAVEKGVTNGTGDGTNGQPKTFSPDDTCTRGQIVTLLHRAYVPGERLPG